MRISAIVARSQNHVIGINNHLPWHLPADLRHFKQQTMGHPIIMGRKTYQSIGRALPGRLNIVISRDPAFLAPGCRVVHTIDQALQAASSAEEVFIIGGAGIYEAMQESVTRWYITVIHHDVKGDTYLAPLDQCVWKLSSQQDQQPDESNAFSYSFTVWDKINTE